MKQTDAIKQPYVKKNVSSVSCHILSFWWMALERGGVGEKNDKIRHRGREVGVGAFLKNNIFWETYYLIDTLLELE